MEENNWQDLPKPLGRMLVPVGQSYEESPKKKRRRSQDGNKEVRRLIIHIVLLVLLLGLIGYGIYDFMHEGPRTPVPQANVDNQSDDEFLNLDE